MAIRTFNVDQEVYEAYAEYCKKEGISMSKRVEKFIREDLTMLTKNPAAPKAVVKSSPGTDHSMRRYC